MYLNRSICTLSDHWRHLRRALSHRLATGPQPIGMIAKTGIFVALSLLLACGTALASRQLGLASVRLESMLFICFSR